MKPLFTALLSFLIVSGALFAQSAEVSQISGTVQDSSGASVPGARITVTHTGTGLTRTVDSGPNGAYLLPSLPIGPYRMDIKKEGFTSYQQTGIVLQVNTNPTIDAILKVGNLSEQVIVEAAAAMVETHTTGVGQVVDQRRVVDLPLNGRQVTQLIALAGAATTTPTSGNLNSTKNYPGEALVSVAGGALNGLTYLLDGASHNDPFNNANLPLPFPDALQEFKVETSALPAQYGQHSAGAVNIVTKSGGNEFHGNAFEFVRNGDFNARDTFAPTRDSLKRNQFGGTFGGPIRKNKLFFFLGYQGTLQRSAPPTQTAYLPTPQMLTGDFTDITSPACNGGRTIPLKPPYINNTISPSLFNTSSLKMLTYFPMPDNPCGKVTYSTLANQTEHTGLARIDYQLSSNHTIFARYLVAHSLVPPTYTGTILSIVNAGTDDEVNSLVLGDTYIFGANTLNTFRATLNRSAVQKFEVPYFSPTDLGINITPLEPNLSNITISNAFTSYGGSAAPGLIYTTSTQVADDVSLVRGAHQIQFGVNWIRPLQNSSFYVQPNGAFTFNGSITGLSMADFLVGSLSSFTQGPITQDLEHHLYLSPYIQDSRKLMPRLTLNYGLRWEPYFGPKLQHGYVTHFDQTLFNQNAHSSVYPNAPAGILFPGDKGFDTGNRPSNIKWNDFAPRFGVVWDPMGNGRTTIRASWGIFYDLPHTLFYYSYSAEPPWGTTVTITQPPGGFTNPWQGFPGGDPFPIAIGDKNIKFPGNATWLTVPLDIKVTYMEQWNLSIQKQIGANWLASANYLGSNSIHLWTDRELNPAVYIPGGSSTANTSARRTLTLANASQGPYFNGLELLDDGGTGSYEALLLSLQHRLANHFTVLGNYTWSHCIQDLTTTGLGSPAYTNPNNRRADRGNCGGFGGPDLRQIFNLSAVAQSPKFSRRWMQAIAGDWQLSGIASARTGNYFSVTNGVDVALNGIGAQRPNQILADPYCHPKTITCWVNSAAFASQATGTLGGLGINNLRGPAYFDVDLALSRAFHVRERYRLEIRGEAFNVANRVNYNNPLGAPNTQGFGTATAALSSSVFGQILSDASPRIMQFAMKFYF